MLVGVRDIGSEEGLMGRRRGLDGWYFGRGQQTVLRGSGPFVLECDGRKRRPLIRWIRAFVKVPVGLSGNEAMIAVS